MVRVQYIRFLKTDHSLSNLQVVCAFPLFASFALLLQVSRVKSLCAHAHEMHRNAAREEWNTLLFLIMVVTDCSLEDQFGVWSMIWKEDTIGRDTKISSFSVWNFDWKAQYALGKALGPFRTCAKNYFGWRATKKEHFSGQRKSDFSS